MQGGPSCFFFPSTTSRHTVAMSTRVSCQASPSRDSEPHLCFTPPRLQLHYCCKYTWINNSYLHFGIIKWLWNVIVAAQNAKIKHLPNSFSSLSPVHPHQKNQACNLLPPTLRFISRQRPLVAILHLHNVMSTISALRTARPFIFQCRQSFSIPYIIKTHFPFLYIVKRVLFIFVCSDFAISDHHHLDKVW